MVLAKALVEREKEMEKTYDPEKGHILPEIPLHEAREIMTRADFIEYVESCVQRREKQTGVSYEAGVIAGSEIDAILLRVCCYYCFMISLIDAQI